MSTLQFLLAVNVLLGITLIIMIVDGVRMLRRINRLSEEADKILEKSQTNIDNTKRILDDSRRFNDALKAKYKIPY